MLKLRGLERIQSMKVFALEFCQPVLTLTLSIYELAKLRSRQASWSDDSPELLTVQERPI